MAEVMEGVKQEVPCKSFFLFVITKCMRKYYYLYKYI